MSSFLKSAPGAGAVAPPVHATTLDGKPLSLGDLKGKYVLLDFWATWCGPCIGEIPQLKAVYDAFGNDERFAILSLSVDEKIEEPKKFQEKRRLPWLQVFIGGGVQNPTTCSFGIRAIPAFVLVGPDGKIVARGMRGDDIKKEVAKALNGNGIREARTRAVLRYATPVVRSGSHGGSPSQDRANAVSGKTLFCSRPLSRGLPLPLDCAQAGSSAGS